MCSPEINYVDTGFYPFELRIKLPHDSSSYDYIKDIGMIGYWL